MPPEQDRNYLTVNYQEQGQIGKGSFGHAYLVKSKRDKQQYVLKKVRLAKQTQWQRNSSLLEQELATTLRHPFIVPCVESWVVDQHTVYMIYAFCKNGDLANHLSKVKEQGGSIEEPVLKKWLCQLLLALDYLQTQKVLHRDIKTSNLLLTSDYDVQLGDFGLATLMQQDGDESRPQDTALVGTPQMMSPEMVSLRNYDYKTDVWSLGCVFYELTAQRPSFNAFDIHGLVNKIRKFKPATLPSTYSPDWRDIIALMLCKRPDARPSVQQLMALPALRESMLEARARARQLMPSVTLPPLLDPTPLSPLPPADDFRSAAEAQDGADDLSECSAGSGSDQHMGGCSRARGSDGESSSKALGSRGDRHMPTGLMAAQALQAHQLSELWARNFNSLQQGQLDSSPQQGHAAGQAAAAAVQQQPQQQGSQVQGSSAAGSSRGSSKASSSSSGSRRSSSSAAPAALADGGVVRDAGTTPDAAATPVDGPKPVSSGRSPHVHQPGINRSPSQRVAAAIAAAPGGRTAPAAAARMPTGRVTPDLCLRPVAAPSSASANKGTRRSDSSSSSSRQAVPGEPQQQPASAAETGQQAGSAGSSSSAGRAASRSPSAGVTPRQGSSSSARDPSDSSGGSGGSASRRTSTPSMSRHPSGGSILATPAAAAPARMPAAATARPLSAPRSSSVRRNSESRTPRDTAGSQQQQQQQQQQTRPPWGAGAGRSCLTPGRQRPEPSPLMKALKLQNGVLAAAAAGAGAGIRPLSARVRSTTANASAASKQEPKQSPGQLLSPVLGGVLSSRGKAGAAAAGVESPAAAEAAAAANGTPHAQLDSRAGPAFGANRKLPARQDLPLASPVLRKDKPQDSCAGRQPSSSSSQRSSDAAALVLEQQDWERLDLLESAMMVIGGLVERKRWVELVSVLRSPGLLPEGMYPGLAAAAAVQQLPQPQQQAATGPLELGQVARLGSKGVPGIIRYIGPVAWDRTGADWVGMEVTTPCSSNGTREGITYFECAPGCASFCKASDLTELTD